MCLAVPGQIISIKGDDALSRSGQVRFGEAVREASLAFVPEAVEGDYVLRAGDRVEIYRPLVVDPKAARRSRAAISEEKKKR